MNTPKTFLEAVRYFADADTCLQFLVALRWPNGVKCPYCGSKKVTFLQNAKLWKCKNAHPRQKFSVKVGTIFEDSPIGLDKWFPAMWLAANCKNGISSYELHRCLGVTQKTAWFMLQQVRPFARTRLCPMTISKRITTAKSLTIWNATHAVKFTLTDWKISGRC